MYNILCTPLLSLSLSSPYLSSHCTKPMPYSPLIMDITNNTSTSSSSWDLDMRMGNQLILDHNPFELVQPIDPFQAQVPYPRLIHGAEIEGEQHEEEEGQLGAMKEMMYKIAAMQPVDIDPSTIKKPKRRNVRISDDPQSIAARQRRERISEKIRILQRMVPGGTKMDTASMLDEAIRYVKFLKRQVQELQGNPAAVPHVGVVDNPGVRPERPVSTHGSSSSSSSTIGVPGLGFNFTSDGRCERMC